MALKYPPELVADICEIDVDELREAATQLHDRCLQPRGQRLRTLGCRRVRRRQGLGNDQGRLRRPVQRMRQTQATHLRRHLRRHLWRQLRWQLRLRL